MANPGKLIDKSIVLIGGTSGLGYSAARTFIREGASVVIVGRNTEKTAAAAVSLGPAAVGLALDAAVPTTAPAAIDLALRTFGSFHALYHVAGGSGRRMGDGPLHEISNEGWQSTLELNLTSLFFSNRAAVQQFLNQNTGGAVLNMTSVLAFSPSPAFFATHAYASAKAAIIGLTRSAAAFYAPRNIRFNAIAPALVETPMSERARQNAAIQQFIRTKQPLDGGRMAQPEDTDAAAVFLLSDDSKFVTGQVLAVDGAWSLSDGQLPV